MRAVSFYFGAAAAIGGCCAFLLFLSDDSSWDSIRVYFPAHQGHKHGGDVPVPDTKGLRYNDNSLALATSSPNPQWRRLDHRPSSFGTKQLILEPEFATFISKSAPDRNFRRDSFVEVDDDPDRKDIVIGFSGNSFLSQVRSVTLEMDCTNESDDAGTIYESDEHMS